MGALIGAPLLISNYIIIRNTTFVTIFFKKNAGKT